MASSIATTPSAIRATRKRDRNDEDDDGIIINLESSAVQTPNSSNSNSTNNNPKQGNGDTTGNYASPIATTSFLGRALSAVTSTVFKRRKVSSPIVEEQQLAVIGNKGIDSTEKPRTDDRKVATAAAEPPMSRSKSPREQPKLFLSPRSPTRKVLQLDLYSSNGKSNVQPAASSNNFTNNYSSMMPSHNGPAPPMSTLPPFQSSQLKQLQKQQQLSNTSLQNNTNMVATSAIINPKIPSFPLSSTDQVLFSLNASNRKDPSNSLDFAFGRLRPKSRLFLHSSKASNQHPNTKNIKLSATETSKRILTALEEQKSLSLMPPPEASSYTKPAISIFGGRDSYNSRLPGTHPFAPTLPPPPPKQRLAQISTTQRPLSQLVQPSTAIIKTTKEKQQQQQPQQPAAIRPPRPPMKSSQANVTIHDSLLQRQPSSTPVVPTSHRKLPSQSQVQKHLQNIRQRKGYLEPYQKIMKNVDTLADSFISTTQENAVVDDEVANDVITKLVEGQLQDHGDDVIHVALNNVNNFIISCQREGSSKRKPLHPKTTSGDAWISTMNSVQEKVTNSTTQPHRAPSMMTTTVTAPVTASTPYSCPLLDKQRDNQVSNKITVSISQVKKSRLGDAGDVPYEPLKQVDSNTLNQFVFKPGPRETAKSESISSQFTAHEVQKEQKQSNHTADVTTSNSNFWGSHMLKPGQWKCSECMLKNDATRAKCASCEAPKPQEEQKQVEDKEHIKQSTDNSNFWGPHMLKPGQWKCSECMSKNDATRAKCASCEAPKPQEEEKQVEDKQSIKQSTDNGGTKHSLPTTMATSINGEISKEKGGFTFVTSTPSTFSSNGTTTALSTSFSFGASTSTNSIVAPKPFQFGPPTTEPGAPVGLTFGASSAFATGTAKPSSDATTSSAVSDSGSTGFVFGSVSKETTKASTNDAIPALSQKPNSAPESSAIGSSSSNNILNSTTIGSATLTSVPVSVTTNPVSSESGGTAVSGPIAVPMVADGSGGGRNSFGSSIGMAPPLLFGTSGTSATAPAFSGFSFGAVPSTLTDGSGFQSKADVATGLSFASSTTKPGTFAFGSGNTSTGSTAPSSSFTFGAAAPAATQDPAVLPFGTANTAAPAPAPAPAVGGFSFGSSSIPSVNAQPVASSTGFAFGGTTAGQVSGITGAAVSNPFATTGISGGFQKDTNAPSIAAAPSSTFSFGSTAGSTPGFAAPMQPTYGAIPTPSTSGLQQVGGLGSMPPGGGFSLGTGGSTGAKRRIIKAKRPGASR